MAYTPATFSATNWSSPVTIAGTDLITNLDEAFNTIASTDTNSLKNWINYTVNTSLPAYLSSELVKINAETAIQATNAANSASDAAASAAAAATFDPTSYYTKTQVDAIATTLAKTQAIALCF